MSERHDAQESNHLGLTTGTVFPRQMLEGVLARRNPPRSGRKGRKGNRRKAARLLGSDRDDSPPPKQLPLEEWPNIAAAKFERLEGSIQEIEKDLQTEAKKTPETDEEVTNKKYILSGITQSYMSSCYYQITVARDLLQSNNWKDYGAVTLEKLVQKIEKQVTYLTAITNSGDELNTTKKHAESFLKDLQPMLKEVKFKREVQGRKEKV
ncbi:hypothetical protein H0H93_015158 [Arthromyces matolae]|nr:hypothetical protein H0H93_015158 [Arthromyces matolae]